MLKIRLQRTGRSNEPTYRIVLTDSQNGPKSGKTLEVLGSYDSRRGDKAQINTDRIKHWLSQGAQASGTMHNLLVDKKIISGKKVNVLPKKRPIKKEGEAAAEGTTPAPATDAAPAAEAAPETAPVAEAAPAETPAA